MKFRKMRSLLTVALILVFTFSLGLSAFAEGTTETATAADTSTTTASTAATTTSAAASTGTADSTATASTVSTQTSTTDSTAATTTPVVKQKGKAKVQLKKVQQQSKVQAKKAQKLMAASQFAKLIDQEVNRPAKAAQKKNVAGARVGVVKKIETADNGKVKIFVQRGDLSKVFNVYFTFNIDPAKILVYDRPTKTQKTVSDIKAGDVVRIIPVRGASLFLVDIIAHPAATPVPVPVPVPEPVPTTPDTLTVQTN